MMIIQVQKRIRLIVIQMQNIQTQLGCLVRQKNIIVILMHGIHKMHQLTFIGYLILQLFGVMGVMWS